MKKLVMLLLAVAVLSLIGCGPVPTRADYSYMDTAPIIEPDEESAVIYFFRESAFIGGGISYFVVEDGKNIGMLKSGSYFIHKTTPGMHTYSAETEAKTFLTLNTDAGKKYYVAGGISIGFWAGRPMLQEVTEITARHMLQQDLKYIRLNSDEEAEAYRAAKKAEAERK